jgi:ABC-type sulfate/molybdate transport systems ATPase subunit
MDPKGDTRSRSEWSEDAQYRRAELPEGRTGCLSLFIRQLQKLQSQRLTLASILVVQPEVFILDEPTSQLDSLGRNRGARAEPARQGLVSTSTRQSAVIATSPQGIEASQGSGYYAWHGG